MKKAQPAVKPKPKRGWGSGPWCDVHVVPFCSDDVVGTEPSDGLGATLEALAALAAVVKDKERAVQERDWRLAIMEKEAKLLQDQVNFASARS